MRRFAVETAILAMVAVMAAVAVSALALAGAKDADGLPALALDDAYIHLQYAWEASQGNWLQYHAGAASSTGATSLLYMSLLALGFGLGLSHEGIVYAELAFGGALFVVSAVLIADIGRRVARQCDSRQPETLARDAGLLAGALFAGSGWMAWAFLSGMETGLLAALALAAIWSRLANRLPLAAAFSALAALTRPEAVILPLAMLGAEFVTSRREPAVGLGGWALRAAPLLAALVNPLVSWALTGSPSSTGLQAKSLLTLSPFYPSEVARLALANIAEIALAIGGPDPRGRWHAFPLTQVLAGIGAFWLWRKGNPLARQVALLCAGWAILGVAATATLQTATWHHYRYQMPFYPALLVLVGVGRALAIDGLAARPSRASLSLVRWGLALAVSLWSIVTLADFAGQRALDTGTIASMQIPLARWVEANAPSNAIVAAHDVGALGYFSGRRTVDVVGLTTAGMPAVFRGGPGSEYEALEALKPDYFMVYPDVSPPYFGVESARELIGVELYRVQLDAYSPFASAGPTQVVSQPRWDEAGLASSPRQPDIVERLSGWTLVDRLDSADLDSEAAHGQTWWNTGQPPGFPSDARRMAYRADPALVLADGGRLMTGGEAFALSAQAGQPLLLVARFHQTADMLLGVKVDDVGVGQWPLPSTPGEWLESAFLIPAEFIKTARPRVTLTVDRIFDGNADTRYSPFHYWAYQGGPAQTAQPSPLVRSRAAFGDAVRLTGYSLSPPAPRPGDSLEVALHWQAIAPPHAELRVFVHLVDPDKPDVAEGIVAQSDHVPLAGVRPFWTFAPDETLVDRFTLAIPANAPAGELLALLGVYDAATGERLPILNEPDFGANRLLLASITIR